MPKISKLNQNALKIYHVVYNAEKLATLKHKHVMVVRCFVKSFKYVHYRHVHK